NIYEFNVDAAGKVYIVDGSFDSRMIHVFEPDGSYLSHLGSRGEGPGEYINPGRLKFQDERLFIYDYGLNRLSSYSTESLEFLNVVSVDPERLDASGRVKDLRFLDYHFLDEGNLLLNFMKGQHYEEEEPGSDHYFRADADLTNLKEKVLEQERLLEIWADFQGMRIMHMFPFFSKPLIAVTESGRIFAAQSEDFLIRELTPHGEEVGRFYYSVEKAKVTREDALASTNDMNKNMVDRLELPDSWPALQEMWTDDEERLWISAFTEAEDEMKWWVLEPNGELIARFTWPGDRQAWPMRSVSTHKIIRDGYFYTWEENEEGLQQVVRYLIEIGEN
ncbi:MAG: 6-bladed beta-propeller, partial [Balneolaceae bacterium]